MNVRFAFPAALSLLLAGCIVPQEIEEAEPPVEGNAPPRILARSPELTQVTVQKSCRTLAFELRGIEDTDRTDALEVRWFVNYGPGATEQAAPPTRVPPPADGTSVRAPFTVRFELQPELYEGQRVVVEAVVSDGFDPDPEAEPAGRAVIAGKDFDEVSWQVEVTPGPECMQ